MSRFEDRSIEDEACASLRPIKSKVNLTSPLKRRYNIYGEAVIGRSRDCDIVVNEKFVSQKLSLIHISTTLKLTLLHQIWKYWT